MAMLAPTRRRLAAECRENVGESSAAWRILWASGFMIFRFSRHPTPAGVGSVNLVRPWF